jgi:phage terminase large subunit
MAGIDRVHGYLAIDKLLHKPKLQVFRSCNHTISEFVTYVYPGRKDGQNSKENPIKQNDHAMDAMRYFITSRPKAYEKPTNAPTGSVEWWLNNLDSNRVDPNVIGNQ